MKITNVVEGMGEICENEGIVVCIDLISTLPSYLNWDLNMLGEDERKVKKKLEQKKKS